MIKLICCKYIKIGKYLITKKYILGYFFLLLFSKTKNYEMDHNATQWVNEQFQDILIDNAIIKKGNVKNYNCEYVYKEITRFLKQYNRPFTVLDFGAAQGYYSFKIANDFNSVCVMIESNNKEYPKIGDQLQYLCEANNKLNNIIFLNKYFNTQQLQHLSECEHFDVILAINVMSDFGNNWKDAVEAFLNMGDNVFFGFTADNQIESDDSIKLIQDYIISKGGRLYADQNSTFILLLVESRKKILQRKTWLLPKMQSNSYTIESDFDHKELKKRSRWTTNKLHASIWIPGINLITFKMCNGLYPSKETIKKYINDLENSTQTDWMINNMILQGSKIKWIDTNDASRTIGGSLKPIKFSQALLQRHHELIDLDDPNKIEHYFWNTLVNSLEVNTSLISLFSKLTEGKSNPKIFNIGLPSEDLIKACLGLGSKVFCFNVEFCDTTKLLEKFVNDCVLIINNNFIRSKLGKVTLDNIITLYGQPNICCVHIDSKEVPQLLRGLSKPITNIVFKFNINYLQELKDALTILNRLGYKSYNFSVRNLEILVLKTNIHTNNKKEWVNATNLLSEIKQYSQLDHEGENLWGCVYANFN